MPVKRCSFRSVNGLEDNLDLFSIFRNSGVMPV